MHEPYVSQVRLLVRVLPLVARQSVFALKGGTAINLFHRDLPRLSVDIDLNYVAVEDRDRSLHTIEAALGKIRTDILRALPRVRAERSTGGGREDTRILVRDSRSTIKIEVSPVARGVVHDTEIRRVSPRVEAEFGFAEVPLVSHLDLFAGKLHAAVDRQHPRDIFDIKLLYENEGISDELVRTFLVYVASSPRPIHELIAPNAQDLRVIYERDFVGMTRIAVSLEELETARSRLFSDLRDRLDDEARTFLLRLHDGEPDFDLIKLPRAANLPAVRWKVQNLERLRDENPQKHREQRNALDSAFD